MSLIQKTGKEFQSTLPAWGATPAQTMWELIVKFQSTLPAWGATIVAVAMAHVAEISIHAPRVGSD